MGLQSGDYRHGAPIKFDWMARLNLFSFQTLKVQREFF